MRSYFERTSIKIFGRKSTKTFLGKKSANCLYASRSKEGFEYQLYRGTHSKMQLYISFNLNGHQTLLNSVSR
jgi:hypothetical protein